MDNIRHILRDARVRTCDAHNAQMASIGMPVNRDCAESMGDLYSTGDIYTTQQTQKSVAPLWIAGILSALGGALLMWALLKDAPPDFEDTNTDTQYKFGLSVEPGGALGESEGDQNDGD